MKIRDLTSARSSERFRSVAKHKVDEELDQFLDRHGYNHSRRKAPAAGRASARAARVAPAPPRPPVDPVALVRRTAVEMGSEGRFHSKVYIAAIWDAIGDELGMSLPEFKRWLLEQNRLGTLVIARGDLPGAMNQSLLARSEILDRGATFHFVMDPSRS